MIYSTPLKAHPSFPSVVHTDKPDYSELRSVVVKNIRNSQRRLKRFYSVLIRKKYPALWEEIRFSGFRSDGHPVGTGFSLEKLYIALHLPITGVCEVCGVETEINEDHGGVRRFCSNKCQANSPDSLRRKKIPYNVRFTPERLRSIVKQREDTNLERRGYKHALQDPTVCMRAIRKGRDTLLQRTGYHHSSHNPVTLAKMQRGSRRYKVFMGKSGKKFQCQGYEPVVLAFLDSHPLVADFNTSSKLHPIEYWTESSSHRYHPDVVATLKDGRTLIIEVKCEHTLAPSFKDLSVNYNKFRYAEAHARQLGSTEFWLAIATKDRIVKWIKSPSRYTFSRLVTYKLDLTEEL